MAEALKPTASKRQEDSKQAVRRGRESETSQRRPDKTIKKERRPKRTIRKIKRTSNNNCQTTSANTKTWDGSESTIGVTQRDIWKSKERKR